MAEKSTTATVEVLTAEVRVLMVGSRQVTLSVFRQLDELPYGLIDEDLFQPMGRVNDKDGVKWIIGRDDNGCLARIRLWKYPRLDSDDYQRLLILRSYSYSNTYLVSQAKEELAELEAMERSLAAERTQWRADKTAYDALPLIIMAGLR